MKSGKMMNAGGPMGSGRRDSMPMMGGGGGGGGARPFGDFGTSHFRNSQNSCGY